MGISKRSFGITERGQDATAHTLTNATGASVTILDYGATVQALLVPDRSGHLVDVVLGYDAVNGYEGNDGYLGATIGRVGNRIGGGRFSLNGVGYQLERNDGANHLHGGSSGFDKQMWAVRAEGQALRCSRISPDGEEGYPGDLTVSVTFALTDDNALHIRYEAVCNKDTPVNLTNHSYFNLNGGGSVLEHELQVFAERFCENDSGCLPTGRLLDVADTPFDFRSPKAIGADIDADNIDLKNGGGYDHNFVLAGRRAAVLYSQETGIEMTVETDLPGMQVYSGNFLTGWPGKNGSHISHRGAICLETQLFPDGLAHYGFPSPVLRAGDVLRSETVYAFSVR